MLELMLVTMAMKNENALVLQSCLAVSCERIEKASYLGLEKDRRIVLAERRS